MARGLSGNVNSELPWIGTELPPGINLSPTTANPNNTSQYSFPNISVTLTKCNYLFYKGYSFKKNKHKAYKGGLVIKIT